MRERQRKGDCPHCGHWDSLVISGQPHVYGYKRYRQCAGCLKRFITHEKVKAITSSRKSPATT